MASILRLPGVCADADDAVIEEWVVESGANVKADDILAMVETDKAVVEIPHSSLRKAIARRLQASVREAPHSFMRATIDTGALAAVRAELHEGAAQVRELAGRAQEGRLRQHELEGGRSR